MSIESLKNAVPGYAKDLKLNLDSLARSTNLDEQKKWGTFLACAAATGSATVLREISEEAGDYLSEEAYAAALAAAAVMGMNNVFYSAKGNMGDDFANERAGLRMNVIANPGVDKADFNLWSFAVSAIGHCEFCTAAHAEDCLKAGISKEGVMDALRIAATTAGLARATTIAEQLA
jgi:alkyl hydroperoxide reductase ahpD